MNTPFCRVAALGVAFHSVAAASPEPVTVTRPEFESGGEKFAPALVVPGNAVRLPGLLMVPNWLGVTDASVEKAKKIAAMGYAVYVADLYTAGVRPSGPEEAGKVAGALRSDRALMRSRMAAAMDHFGALAKDAGVPEGRFGAIGFCFGGGAVLEFARAGAPLRGVVSFHGDLVSPTLAADSGKITAKVLVLHGDADPVVPAAHVEEWMSAMRGTAVDWQFVSYGGAVHSFTDPAANSPGRSEYHPVVAARAFAAMHAFFQEAFGGGEPES